ncbi:MAG TPA: carboxypeptidase-like regulatory domain-containing protein [Candidatus Angelobacter sp.]|nr:carboxypeptidase-like regulatory domain-containing protein [Candidatus Angelobacter sp.]
MAAVSSPAQVQTPAPCRDVSYPDISHPNDNRTEKHPLTLPEVKGIAIDARGVAMTGACVALFTDEHKLIAVVQADEDGWFTIPETSPGDYGIVVRAEKHCPAMARIRIGKKKLTIRRNLHAHMRAAEDPRCSYIALK